MLSDFPAESPLWQSTNENLSATTLRKTRTGAPVYGPIGKTSQRPGDNCLQLTLPQVSSACVFLIYVVRRQVIFP